MRHFIVLAIFVVVTPGFATTDALPKPWPTALERFVKHRHTEIVQLHEAARLSGIARASGKDGWMRVVALIARNHHTHPTEMRGIWFEVSDGDTVDNVYLPLARVQALKERLAWLEETSGYFYRGTAPLAEMGTEDCRPSLPLPRMHKLCVGLYRRIEDSGLSISSGNASLYLSQLELDDFADTIDSALASIQHR